MQHLWLLLLWLAFITIFFVDTQATLLFVGPQSEPRVRQEWAAVLLLVPLIALLLTPIWAWAVGATALCAAGRLTLHLVGYRRIMDGLEAAPPAAVDLVRSLAAEWGLRRLPEVRIDPTDRWEPAVAGLLNPVLILTPSALALPAGDLRAVLAHELAHVRSGDPLRLWAAGVARSLLGWHPLARRAVDHLVLEVEMAADRQAVSWLGDRRGYVLALANWGLRRGGEVTRTTGVALTGMSSQLLLRLTCLVDDAAPAPHLVLPSWMGRQFSKKWSARFRWFHLLLGAGYLALFAVARLLL